MPVLHLAIATHSEDQPDYSANKILYTNSRNALIAFAQLMAARGLAWNWQCDWSFLNAAYTNDVLLADPALLAATANTNIVAWLRYVMGVETDPHSHENGGYNYADVAYLYTRMGVTPSGVVGGHIYDPAYATFSDWPKFTGAGLRGAIYTNYTWRPHLLMGAGTPNHIADPVATGIWFPAATNDYFTHSPTGGIASWGAWDQDRFSELLDLMTTNALPTNRMWTAGVTIGQGHFVLPGFLTNVVAPMLDMIAALRDAGRIRVVQYEEGLNLWTNSFGTVAEVRRAPLDTLTFSLNVQDFSYPELSADVIDRAVTLHEAAGVPVDVFLTTTMVDLYQSNYPALLNRLFTSPVVALAYHTRAPVPYRVNYDWAGLQSMTSNQVYNVVTNYETHGLDLITGQPTPAFGGYAKLRTLAGYAPFAVGVASETPLNGPVQTAFNRLGARINVVHGRAVNLTNRTVRGMYEKPEHVDLRLFETNYDGVASAVILSNAFQWARSSNDVAPPYFVGVKMHDNDFFAVDSAWLTVYTNRTPTWPHAYTTRSPLLSTNEMTNLWNRYEQMVRHVGTNNPLYTPLNARGILRRLGLGPQWPHLATARLAEAAPPGTVAGTFTAVSNRTTVLPGVTWQFTSGAGDCHNGEFTLSNGVLRAAAGFDHETQAVRYIRVRAADTNSLWAEQYFAVVVTNIVSDDDDGDGHTEAQELLAGTDPLDANSALRFGGLTANGGGFTASWDSVAGKTYILQSATNVAGPYADMPGTQTNAMGTLVGLDFAATNAAGFYRLRLVLP
ncbi:MAG: cadherin repeat domain-containing protein [Pedosphaera sp.]|nr:cadherin repeat domain-containing protein [Pedosphaera sp.]